MAPRLEPFKVAIDEMLRSDLEAPKKQRHTARRVLARLVDEHDAAGLSYSTVRDHVRKRRPQIAAEAGRALEAGFVPQTYRPGAEAEVDFHDLWVVLAGVKTKTALFTMRLSFSGRAAHRAFATQGQEAFLEGHVYGFDRLGGVPVDKIRYDNLNSAVKQVLFGRSRQENERWIAFRSHYGFEAWYCQPGHEGSHEKGGVEGEGGRFRRTHCVPMPVVESIDELNAILAAADDADDRRRIANRANTVGQDWQTEKPALQPVTGEPFDTALSLTPRVDRYAQIMVRCNQYSVPARFIGHRLRVKLSASMSPSMTARLWWHAIRGRSVRAPRCWSWIITWRSWPANPGHCPGPPHCCRPGRPRCSPPSTTPGGRPRGGPTATPPAPGLWWRCCCCIATSTTPMCSPGSPLHCRWAPPTPMSSRWRHAKLPNDAAPAAAPTPPPVGRCWCWPSTVCSMRVGCPQLPPTTVSWAGRRHDRATQCHRAGRGRSDRAGLPNAAAAHDA
ncbi:IstA2 [Mycolicibacterium phlei RIVM601174]|nr:IstA2 [Mycolicibacterium phlei RIVM601174]